MISSPLDRIQEAVADFYEHFYVLNKATEPLPSQTALKICGELGELAETINKGWSREEQEKEFGDVLVTCLMHAINSGYSLKAVSRYVVQKLTDRKKCCVVKNGLIVKNKDINGNPTPDKNYGITSTSLEK